MGSTLRGVSPDCKPIGLDFFVKFLFHVFTAAYCTDITDQDASPATNIRYGDTVQKQCSMRNGDVVMLERKCGFNHFMNDYRTSGDSFQCPGK